MNDTKYKCWECKIGPQPYDLPMGSDSPMRKAVEQAYFKLTGKHPEWCFSGWSSDLNEFEKMSLETNPYE